MGPKGAQGRGRNYSAANTTYLLDLIEEVEPCGCDEWNEISLKYNANFGGRSGENRSGDDLKNKFKALKNAKKPTGDPTCPPDVRRAKNIQKAIEGRMDVRELGSGDEKDNDLNDDDNTNDNNDDNNYNHCGHSSDDNNTGDYIEDDLLPNVDFLVNSTNDCANPAASLLQHAMSVQASSFGMSGSSGSQSGSSSSAEVPSGSSGLLRSSGSARLLSGSSSAIGVSRETLGTTGFRSTPAGSRPPLPKRSATTPKATSTPAPRAPTTTLRTGLTEEQLRNMSATVRERSPSPQYSETVAKKRKIDSLLEKGTEFLQGGSQSGDSIIHMMMMQNSQREARSEELRRVDREREDRREERRERDAQEREERREREDREREERREDRKREERIRDEEARQEREDRREEREREREERREKMERERMEYMAKR